MKNTDIEKLINDKWNLCAERGEQIAKMETTLDSIKDGIDILTVRQADWIDRAIQTEKDVLVLKTQKKGIVAIVGTVASIISLSVGIFVDHLLRR